MAMSSPRGGGDCRTLLERKTFETVLAVVTMPWRSSEVAWGVKGLAAPPSLLIAVAEGVRRCLLRYEAERGSAGREEPD
jgi:hypothetical protein